MSSLPDSISGWFEQAAKVSDIIGTLAKREKNKYAGYNYVSIDDYYEHVAKTCRQYGVMWCVSEDGHTCFDGDYLMFRYKFYAVLSSGLHDLVRLTVPHPTQGAQTSGSALSYAEKLFMRSIMKIPTGEQDADAMPQYPDRQGEKFSKEPPRNRENLPVDKISKSAKIDPDTYHLQFRGELIASWSHKLDDPTFAGILEVINAMKSVDDIREFWAGNERTFMSLKQDRPSDYSDITGWLKERETALKDR